jgi:hypothetical protein
MMPDKDESKILAEHGRWISRLRDDLQVIEKRMTAVERRISIIEVNFAELVKEHVKIDLMLSSVTDGPSIEEGTGG